MDVKLKNLLIMYLLNKSKIETLDADSKMYGIMALKSYRRMRNMHFLLLKSKNRNKWSSVEKSTFWEYDVPQFSNTKFKNRFRMKRTTFNDIVQNLSSLKKKDTYWRKSIPLEKRAAMSLYALGSSAEYRTVASLFGVGRTTLGQIIILDFCRAIIKVYGSCFKEFYPSTQHKIEENVRGFLKLGFPQCYGAIDGCHIKLKPPKKEATDYFNFKGSYSSILFAAVDYRYRFMFISVGTPGRSNDSSIWESSSLKKQHEENKLFENNSKIIDGVKVPVLLIGDFAFRLSPIVTKPYSFCIDQPEDERIYNEQLSKSRRVVENAFGHLKARFRRFGKGLENNLENTNTIIKACCVLHNLLNEHNDDINEKWLGTTQRTTRKARETTTRRKNETLNTGIEIRNALKNYIVLTRTDDGPGSADDGPGSADDGPGFADDGPGSAGDGNGLASDGNGLASDGNGLASDGNGLALDDAPNGDSGEPSGDNDAPSGEGVE